LDCPTLHYAVYGRLNAARDNAVLVCHALSGSALVGSWWPEIFAPGAVSLAGARLRHLHQHAGLLLRLHGARFRQSRNRRNLRADFPLVSVRDNVRAQAKLLDSLGIRKLRLVLGGSIGGMQALEWTILHPERVERALIIGVDAALAMGLALNHLQRQAIQHDPEWAAGRYLPQRPPRRGLALARQIAMISYKSAPLFDERFGRNPNRSGEDPYVAEGACGGLTGGRFDIGGYLDYQGRRFIERFDANAYLAILRAMDTWDPMRGYASPEEAFGRIRARLSFIGISSDWLFPAERCASLPTPSGRASMPITARWKATTATTPFWPSRQSWCGFCNDARTSSATGRIPAPLPPPLEGANATSGHQLRTGPFHGPLNGPPSFPGLGKGRARSHQPLLVRGGRAWLSIILLRSIGWRGIVLSVAPATTANSDG
jgi:homoserine O-acetyltransferase